MTSPALFEYDSSSRNGMRLPGDKVTCPQGEEYINADIGCRKIEQHTKQFITISVDILHNNNLTSGDREMIAAFQNNVCEKLNFSSLQRFDNLTDVVCHNVMQASDMRVSVVFEIELTWIGCSDFTNACYSNDTVSSINSIIMNETRLLDALISIGLISSIILNGEQERVLDRLICEFIKFGPNEYKKTANGTIEVILSKQKLEENEYIRHGNFLYVCKEMLDEDEINDDNDGNSEQFILAILTIIFMSLSALFLLIRLTLQYFIPIYHTFPIKLQFAYCVALLIAIIMFLVGPIARPIDTLCKIVGILLHYSFLASFMWMTVIAGDMFLMFRSLESMQKASERKGFKAMLPYHILAWGIPAVLVTVSLIVDHTPPKEHSFKPRYGEDRCWMTSESFAVLLFFGTPIFIATILNTTFFILVALKLRHSFKQRTTMTQDGKNNWSVYIKLFLMMGVGCGSLILTPFIDHIVLWIIIIITTAGQGIYISLISIFNPKVMDYMRAKWNSKFTDKTPERHTNETSLSSSQVKIKTKSHTSSSSSIDQLNPISPQMATDDKANDANKETADDAFI